MKASYLQGFLSPAARGATPSEIRELLKVIAQPEIISLAGGLPSPESFPIDELAEMLPEILRSQGVEALQYGPTEGNEGLRRELVKLVDRDGGRGDGPLTVNHILVTSASQQGLDLCSRAFLGPDDVALCALPSYLGALGAFSASGARLCGIPLDDDGLRTDKLEERLVDLRGEGIRPKFIYTVPDFQNPSGVSLCLSRRRELLAIASEFDLLVIEDSPYRQLRYVGSPLPSLCSLDQEGRVISLFTFSKIVFPGLRLGWIVAAPEIISRLVIVKQPVDLCTSGLSQLVAREYLSSGLLPAQIERIRKLYSAKRDAILAALSELMDPRWGVRWTVPAGGMFLWVTLPDSLDARKLLEQALEEKVAFVSGSAFHCDGSGHNTLRLNFSYPDLKQLRVAIERLAVCIRQALEQKPTTPRVARPSMPVVAGQHALEQLVWNLALSEVVE